MSKGERQRTAREKLAEERKRQAARDKQRRLLVFVLGGLVAVGLIVALTVVVVNNQGKRDQVAVAYSGPSAPVTRQDDGSIAVAKAGVTAPVLEIYEDFQCPACQSFEEQSGETMLKLAADGKVKLVFRPFQLFQQEPLASVSRRGLNATFCAPTDKWLSLHHTLFEYQPMEGREGFTNEDLINWATDLGFNDPAFEKCVTDMQKAEQIEQATQYATAQKVESTPTVRLNGQPLQGDGMSPEGLRLAVEAAQQK